MKNFYKRDGYSEQEARKLFSDPFPKLHLIINDGGTYSVMHHINSEWCDYCDEQGDARFNKNIKPISAKSDPYENQNKSVINHDEVIKETQIIKLQDKLETIKRMLKLITDESTDDVINRTDNLDIAYIFIGKKELAKTILSIIERE